MSQEPTMIENKIVRPRRPKDAISAAALLVEITFRPVGECFNKHDSTRVFLVNGERRGWVRRGEDGLWYANLIGAVHAHAGVTPYHASRHAIAHG